MNFREKRGLLQAGVFGLSSAAFWVFCSTGYIAAQEAAVPAPAPAAVQAPAQNQAPPATQTPAKTESDDNTITLTKVVEVYEFEGRNYSIEEYEIGQGDTLAKILKAKGLITKGRSDAQTTQLIKILNPDVTNWNVLSPDQKIFLPSGPALENAPGSQGGGTTHTVKIYGRQQDKQQDTQVVVLKHGEPAPKAAEEPKSEAGTIESDPAKAEQPVEEKGGEKQPDQPPAASGGLVEYESGNEGPLEMASNDNVVYRTVKIKRGDNLEKILRREGMDRDLIYQHLLQLTVKLNPEVKNPNLIIAGAELKIPAAGSYLDEIPEVNSEEVRQAALKVAQGQGMPANKARARQSRADNKTAKTGPTVTAPKKIVENNPKAAVKPEPKATVADLPQASVETAKYTLSMIFAGLGDNVNRTGHLTLPIGLETLDIDQSKFPVVELSNGINVVIDLESALPQAFISTLRSNYAQYMVFQTRRNESVEQALDRLWPLCGYYRFYKKDQTYEGGSDLKLSIASDWIVWPTVTSWNTGKPLVINKAAAPDKGTPPAWGKFLNGHGIKVIDLYKGNIIPVVTVIPDPGTIKIVELDKTDPVKLASGIIGQLGVEVKVNHKLELGKNPKNADAAPDEVIAPVYWERGKNKTVLEFGSLSKEDGQKLRKAGYRVVSSKTEAEAIINSIVTNFGLKTKNDLVINGTRTGGPKISLTIKGKSFTHSGRQVLLTEVALPPGLSTLSDEELTILRY